MRSQIANTLSKLSWGFFCATIVLIPFRFRILLLARPVDLIWKDYTDFLVFAADITLLLALGFWLVHLYLQPHKINTGPSFLTLPLAGLTLAALVTSITSIDPAVSFYHSIRLVILFGFYLYIVNHVSSIKQLATPLSIMIGVQSVVAITQVLRQKSLGLELVGELTLDPTIRGLSVIWTQTARSLRAYGLSDHPNILGGCLLFGVLILFVWLCFRQSKQQFFQGFVFSTGAVAIFLTYSRSAWLAGVLGFTLIGFLIYRERRRDLLLQGLMILAGTALILLPFVLANGEFLGVRLGANQSFDRIQTEIASIGERAVLNRAANEIFVEHSLLGVGLGTLPEAFKIKFPDFSVYYQPGHVVFLDVAAETGLFGALFYLILLIGPWVVFVLRRPKKMTPELIAASGLLLAISVVGFFDYYTWLSQAGRLWQWLAWGLWSKFYVDAS